MSTQQEPAASYQEGQNLLAGSLPYESIHIADASNFFLFGTRNGLGGKLIEHLLEESNHESHSQGRVAIASNTDQFFREYQAARAREGLVIISETYLENPEAQRDQFILNTKTCYSDIIALLNEAAKAGIRVGVLNPTRKEEEEKLDNKIARIHYNSTILRPLGLHYIMGCAKTGKNLPLGEIPYLARTFDLIEIGAR